MLYKKTFWHTFKCFLEWFYTLHSYEDMNVLLFFPIVREFSVQDLVMSTSTVFILLRHFAWLPWRDHVAQVESQKTKFEALNGEVLIISFGNLVSTWKSCATNFLVLQLSVVINQLEGLPSSFGLGFYKVWICFPFFYDKYKTFFVESKGRGFSIRARH